MAKRRRESSQVWNCQLAYVDLRWVTKRTRKYTEVQRKLQKQTISVQPCARARTTENNVEANLP